MKKEMSCFHLLVKRALILFSTSFLNDLVQCIFQEVKIQYDTSILKRKSVVQLL